MVRTHSGKGPRKFRQQHILIGRITRLKKNNETLSRSNRKKDERLRKMSEVLEQAKKKLSRLSNRVKYAELRGEIRMMLRRASFERPALAKILLNSFKHWMLPTSIAVFLQSDDGDLVLYASENKIEPSQDFPLLLNFHGRAITEMMREEKDIVFYLDIDELMIDIGAEDSPFVDDQVIVFSCGLKEECHAVIVMVRPSESGFKLKTVRNLDKIRPIVTEELSKVFSIIKRSHWKVSSGNQSQDESQQ